MVIAPDAERVLELASQFRKALDEIGTQVPAHALVCAGCDALLSETVPVAENPRSPGAANWRHDPMKAALDES